MNENKNEIQTAAEKPYTFRKLSGDDLFLVVSIIHGIGIKEFKKIFDGENLEMLTAAYRSNEDAESGEKITADKAIMAIGANVILDVADVILGNLPKCKLHIYQLLSSVSGISADEIRSDAVLFTEMLVDFIKNPEFQDFFKAASRLFK